MFGKCPASEARSRNVKVGDLAKVSVEYPPCDVGCGENFFVCVTEVNWPSFKGTVHNHLCGSKAHGIEHGDVFAFKAGNIRTVVPKEQLEFEAYMSEKLGGPFMVTEPFYLEWSLPDCHFLCQLTDDLCILAKHQDGVLEVEPSVVIDIPREEIDACEFVESVRCAVDALEREKKLYRSTVVVREKSILVKWIEIISYDHPQKVWMKEIESTRDTICKRSSEIRQQSDKHYRI